MILEPCFCGGLPYTHPYYRPDDVDKMCEMYTVKCMVCNNCVAIEYTMEEAVLKWNNYNILEELK